MAYDEERHEEIASLLDEADHLFNLINDEKDLTIEFRKHLELIANRFNWHLPVDRFDKLETKGN